MLLYEICEHNNTADVRFLHLFEQLVVWYLIISIVLPPNLAMTNNESWCVAALQKSIKYYIGAVKI